MEYQAVCLLIIKISTLIFQKITLDININKKGLRYCELCFQVNNAPKVHMKTNKFEFNKLSSGSSSMKNKHLRKKCVLYFIYKQKLNLFTSYNLILHDQQAISETISDDLALISNVITLNCSYIFASHRLHINQLTYELTLWQVNTSIDHNCSSNETKRQICNVDLPFYC